MLAWPAPDAVPVVTGPPLDLVVALASLAQGGAERLVVSWLERVDPARHRVRLLVLRATPFEYPVPPPVRVERLHGPDRLANLAAVAAGLRGGRPVLCHLLDDDELGTLWAHGVRTIPVIHNDRAGWRSTPARFPPSHVPLVIAIADAVASGLRAGGWRGPLAVLRLPVAAPPRSADPRVRAAMRERLGIGDDELLVVMVGGVKPQKAYPRAVRALAAIRERRPARLAIVGGPIGRDGRAAWAALTGQIARLGLSDRVLLPGFTDAVGPWLAAADVFLNTSTFEGLSVATREALAAGLPAVATDVGGQREIVSPGLQLVPPDAPPEAIAARVVTAPRRRLSVRDASGASGPAASLWTGFATWPPASGLRREVLIVTANLNAGGAQRSLVTVAAALAGRLPLAVAAVGGTTQPEFASRLAAAGVPVFRPTTARDPIAAGAALAARGVPAVVSFWNADPHR